jgi:hypothetical protein
MRFLEDAVAAKIFLLRKTAVDFIVDLRSLALAGGAAGSRKDRTNSVPTSYYLRLSKTRSCQKIVRNQASRAVAAGQ